jgi:hypothetical protein
MVDYSTEDLSGPKHVLLKTLHNSDELHFTVIISRDPRKDKILTILSSINRKTLNDIVLLISRPRYTSDVDDLDTSYG